MPTIEELEAQLKEAKATAKANAPKKERAKAPPRVFGEPCVTCGNKIPLSKSITPESVAAELAKANAAVAKANLLARKAEMAGTVPATTPAIG